MKTPTRKVAEAIARDLFTDGQGRRANRLVMKHGKAPSEKDGAGWCESAVADRIEEKIRHSLRVVGSPIINYSPMNLAQQLAKEVLDTNSLLYGTKQFTETEVAKFFPDKEEEMSLKEEAEFQQIADEARQLLWLEWRRYKEDSQRITFKEWREIKALEGRGGVETSDVPKGRVHLFR